jgi:hypothetical protein
MRRSWPTRAASTSPIQPFTPPRAGFGDQDFYPDLNDVTWDPDPPDVDEAEAAILAVAAHHVDEPWFAEWLRRRIRISGE